MRSHAQSEMVQLINDEYVPFVTLSSSLANMRQTLDKLRADHTTVASDFTESTSDVSDVCAQVDEISL